MKEDTGRRGNQDVVTSDHKRVSDLDLHLCVVNRKIWLLGEILHEEREEHIKVCMSRRIHKGRDTCRLHSAEWQDAYFLS
jgi:hypothetical protein